MDFRNAIQKVINDIPEEKIQEADKKMMTLTNDALKSLVKTVITYLSDKKLIESVKNYSLKILAKK